MKWCIVPDVRDEMARNCIKGGRGGHRGSSQPTSPANYSSRPSRDMVDEANSMTGKDSPSLGSPGLSALPSISSAQFTPDRGRQLSRSHVHNTLGDGSPMPKGRRPYSSAYGLPDLPPHSPPTASSVYQSEETQAFVTPAPLRVHPHLAPPSTAQRPSQHMPTSSPAPFWKYADLGVTPKRNSTYGSSPIKGGNEHTIVPPSSSPPRPMATSPSRIGNGVNSSVFDANDIEEEEEHGFDLTRLVVRYTQYTHGANTTTIVDSKVLVLSMALASLNLHHSVLGFGRRNGCRPVCRIFFILTIMYDYTCCYGIILIPSYKQGVANGHLH